MYVDPDYPSKKAFMQAIKDGVKHIPYNPSGMFTCPHEGQGVVEGPHYPRPHKWYAQVTLSKGVVISAK